MQAQTSKKLSKSRLNDVIYNSNLQKMGWKGMIQKKIVDFLFFTFIFS